MGFRFSGNTMGNKGHKRDGRTEALSNKQHDTVWSVTLVTGQALPDWGWGSEQKANKANSLRN